MTKKVWVLTSEHNSYDQYGEYFEAVWEKKPTVEKLADFFHKNDGQQVVYHDPMSALKFLLHVHNGGGRIGTEHQWYNLAEKDLL